MFISFPINRTKFVKQSIVELVWRHLISVEEEEEFVNADSTTINKFQTVHRERPLDKFQVDKVEQVNVCKVESLQTNWKHEANHTLKHANLQVFLTCI